MARGWGCRAALHLMKEQEQSEYMTEGTGTRARGSPPSRESQ